MASSAGLSPELRSLIARSQWAYGSTSCQKQGKCKECIVEVTEGMGCLSPLVAEERHLDLPRWTLDRTDAESVRKLAAVLGVQYRAIENGDFNHSTVISLLDRDGRIAARSSRTGEADPDLLAATKRELAVK